MAINQIDGSLKIKDNYQLIYANDKYLDDRISNIITGQDLDPNKDSELVDARLDSINNITYNFLKLRLDAMSSGIKENNKPMVVFTFDDGIAGDSLSYQALKDNGYVGCYGLITDNIYDASKNDLNNYYQYQKEGFEILSHSSTHVDLTSSATDLQIDYEYRKSAEKLRKLGFNAPGLIIPYSNAVPTALDKAKEWYDFVLVGGATGLNKTFDGSKLVERISQYALGVQGTKDKIDEAIATNSLLVFYDHAIGAVDSLTDSEFREVLTYLKTKTDNEEIVVGNMSDAMTYYFGKNVNEYEKGLIDTKNYAKQFDLNRDDLVFVDHQSIGADGNIENFDEIYRIDIPTCIVGDAVSLQNVIEIDDFEQIGEMVNFSQEMTFSNSQFDHFKTTLEIRFQNDTTILDTVVKEVSLNNVDYLEKGIRAFLKPGNVLSNVNLIKCYVRVECIEDTTATQFFRIRKPMINFTTKKTNETNAILNNFEYFRRETLDDGYIDGQLPNLTWVELKASSVIDTNFYTMDATKSLVSKVNARFKLDFNLNYVLEGAITPSISTPRLIFSVEKNTSVANSTSNLRTVTPIKSSSGDEQMIILNGTYDFKLEEGDTLSFFVYKDLNETNVFKAKTTDWLGVRIKVEEV